jgi:ornithine cyclodeaminase/alanine dehydrogenase-like protein (mu-crystallin family)
MQKTSIVLLSGRDYQQLLRPQTTGIRTATAAFAAQYGARKESTRAAIIGCGAQAKYQLEAMRSVFDLRTMRVFDIDEARAEAFAANHSASDCTVVPAPSIRAAVAEVDICITCTTSNSPALTEDLNLKGLLRCRRRRRQSRKA